MSAKRLREFLDGCGVKYTIIKHSTAYTAPEIAASAHISGRELAKTVMVKIDGRMAMAVVRGIDSVDVYPLKVLAEATSVKLATEREFAEMFPDCDIGAMPPFGNLYNMALYVDEKLSLDQEISFNACSHNELIKMAYKDFERLAQPRVGVFAVKPALCGQ